MHVLGTVIVPLSCDTHRKRLVQVVECGALLHDAQLRRQPMRGWKIERRQCLRASSRTRQSLLIPASCSSSSLHLQVGRAEDEVAVAPLGPSRQRCFPPWRKRRAGSREEW